MSNLSPAAQIIQAAALVLSLLNKGTIQQGSLSDGKLQILSDGLAAATQMYDQTGDDMHYASLVTFREVINRHKGVEYVMTVPDAHLKIFCRALTKPGAFPD